jgi:hypothetical protein
VGHAAQHTDHRHRESGVAACGTIATGRGAAGGID